MRLCLVTPGFSASESDWCIPALHHLVRRLTRDHRVTVLTLRHPPARDPYPFLGARVVPLGGRTCTGVRRAVLLLRAVRAIRLEHRRYAVDLVHGLWADEAGAVAALSARTLGLRSVVSVLGGELVGMADIGYGVQLGAVGRQLVRFSLRAADQVTAGSAALAELVGPVRGRRPLRLTPLGIDPELFKPTGPRAPLSGDPCLLQVAALTPVKGQELLLAAFSRLRTSLPGAHLHLVGDGPRRVELVELARSLGCGGSVQLHGEIPHDALPPFYRAADTLVVSSRFESQGMSVVEAAACATPAVGPAVGILPELARDAAARTVAEPDPTALAAALVEVLADRSHARAVGAAALERVRSGLTLDQCVARLEAVYAEARSGGRARR